MSDKNFKVVRVGLSLALLFTVPAVALLLPTTSHAIGSAILVPAPNGHDDTANIQAALNSCVAQGPGCTVELQVGKYLTKQLVTYNFHGTFKGMGMDVTSIEALPNLPVTINQDISEEPQCQPNTTSCIWPSLIMFVDGDIEVSDLSIKITAVPAVQPWYLAGSTLTMLFEVLGFRGQYPMHVGVDRIRMEGQPDNTPGSFGFNVLNGAHFTGELPRSPVLHDYYFLSGSFAARNSYYKNLFVGISQDGFVTSSQITIGGSPFAGNHLENVCGGLDIEASENSVFEISYNESSGSCAGMWVVPWIPAFVPSSPSRYLVHDNKFIGTAQGAEGFYFWNEPTNPWIHAAAWHNTVELQNSLSEGIGAYNTTGTAIWDNSVTGMNGFDAVGLHNSTLSRVIHNNVSNFTVDGNVGYAQIYLDSSTTQDLVVCAESSDTLLNQGANNIVLGCDQPGADPETTTKSSSAWPSAPSHRMPKGKPWLQ